jgi:HK97 family phage major capsid protein
MYSTTTFGDFLQDVKHAEISHSTRHKIANQKLEPFRRSTPAGQSEQVLADGGFLVPPEFVTNLIERVYQTGEVLSRCMEIPMSSNSLAYHQFDESSRADGSRFGGLKSYWANEADTATATKAKFRRSELTAKKIISLVYLTDELQFDSAQPAMEVFVTAGFAKETAFRLEQSIVSGDGAGKPQGIIGSPALVQIAKDGGQTAGTISATNVTSMYQAVWAPSRRTGLWLVNPEAENQLIGLTVAGSSGGGVKWLYEFADDDDDWNRMLGRPVIPHESCPVAGKPGDLIFADLSRYVIGMREQGAAAVSLEVKFLTDEAAFRFVMRVDGQTLDNVAVTPLNGSIATSPFVAIAAR